MVCTNRPQSDKAIVREKNLPVICDIPLKLEVTRMPPRQGIGDIPPDWNRYEGGYADTDTRQSMSNYCLKKTCPYRIQAGPEKQNKS